MFCVKCGKELPENSVYCSECGTRVGEKLENKTKDSGERKLNFKIILSAVFALIVVCIGIGYINYSSQPSVKYKKAEEAVAKQNYDKAIDLYTDLGEYLDSADKLSMTILLKHYSDGCELYERGEYDSAIEELEQAEQNDDTQEMINKAYYGKAIELLESKNYIEAASAFKNSNWYSDSDEKILETGKVLVENGDYNTAVTIFDGIHELQNNEYVQYANGMLNYQNKKYKEASINFSKAGTLFDSEEKYNESTYKYASQQIEAKNYEEAKTAYTQIVEYEDSKEMINACDLMLAKAEMEKGNLEIALKALQNLPEEYSYDNIGVLELLDRLNSNSQWVSVCGKWESTKGLAESYCRSRITGNQMGTWSHDIEAGDYTLDIKCSINNDGTITVSGNGSLFEFTNWSTIKIGLDYNVNKSISFSKTIDSSSFGKAIEIDDNITVTFSDDKVILKYVVNDNNSSSSFTYKYETNITYKK